AWKSFPRAGLSCSSMRRPSSPTTQRRIPLTGSGTSHSIPSSASSPATRNTETPSSRDSSRAPIRPASTPTAVAAPPQPRHWPWARDSGCWRLSPPQAVRCRQATASNGKKLGHTVTWNSVAQYRLARTGVARFFWPEVESNSSFFIGGPNDGKATTFATPGILIGRIPLTHDAQGKPGRLGGTFGAGEQIAGTKFHNNNHDLVLTA